MLATRLDPPPRWGASGRWRGSPGPGPSADPRDAAGRSAGSRGGDAGGRAAGDRSPHPAGGPSPRPGTRQPRPTRGPHGEVRWWEREAPRGDEALWRAVQRLHERQQTLGVSLSELARRTDRTARPLRRETLSRVFNGTQPTTWDAVEVLAELLGVSLDDL